MHTFACKDLISRLLNHLRKDWTLEFAVYMLITLGCALAIVFGAINAARKPGAKARGPFVHTVAEIEGEESSLLPLPAEQFYPWKRTS